jgi:hypothetical protein
MAESLKVFYRNIKEPNFVSLVDGLTKAMAVVFATLPGLLHTYGKGGASSTASALSPQRVYCSTPSDT